MADQIGHNHAETRQGASASKQRPGVENRSATGLASYAAPDVLILACYL